MTIAIEIRNLSKRYIVSSDKANTLKEVVIGIFRRRSKEEVLALSGVDLCVSKGETLGIIGDNGAGKSTLLKLITGVTCPTNGSVTVNGSLMGLIELGAGFQPELTGIENIYLQGAILGIPERQMESLLPHVIAFAEIDEFIRTPVKHYSSGMVLRLGFAVASAIEPEILLLDENFAVGDAAFQAKCMARLNHLRRKGTTILLVTHQLDVVESICDRVVWLKEGRILHVGKPSDTIKRYENASSLKQLHEWKSNLTSKNYAPLRPGRFGTGEVLIEEVSLVNDEGEPTHIVESGSTLRIHFEIEARTEAPHTNFEISFIREDQLAVMLFNLKREAMLLDLHPGRYSFDLELPKLALSAGRYFFNVAVSSGEDSDSFYDIHLFLYHFRVVSNKTQPLKSLFQAPVRISVQSAAVT